MRGYSGVQQVHFEVLWRWQNNPRKNVWKWELTA